MWWDYSEPKTLLNTPVKFIGRDKTISNKNKYWFNLLGQYVFEIQNEDKDKVYAHAKDDFFKTKHIENE
jgi:hypothetical protein